VDGNGRRLEVLEHDSKLSRAQLRGDLIEIMVRFGQGSDGGVGDIWFDNLELRTMP
jgi:hypothetical protein